MDHPGRICQKKAGATNTLVARQSGCTPRSVRNAGLTLRAKEQQVDDMIVFKDEKPVNEESDDRGWN